MAKTFTRSFLELIIGNVLEYFVGPLKAALFTRMSMAPNRIDGFPSHSLGYGMLPMSPWEEDGFGNETFGLPGVHLFG
jgi:hypothetical protein